MKIREITMEDYPEIDRLMKELHRLHMEGRPDLFPPLEHPYSREEFETLVQDPDKIAILSEEDSEVTGLCIGSFRKKTAMVQMKTLYIDDFIVDPDYRKRGIATGLFREMEKRGREAGAVRLDLMVWDFNKGARSFYEAQGMKPQRYIYEKDL